MKDLKYFGKVDDGKLTIFQRNDMVSGLQNLGSGFVEIIIRLAGKRSSPQNRYYWGAMLPIVKDGLKGVGIEMSKEQTHEMLKYKFIKREFITSDGDILQSIGSTTELSTKGGISEIVTLPNMECIEVDGDSTEENKNLRIWPCQHTLNQNFRILPSESGFHLRAENSNFCLNLSNKLLAQTNCQKAIEWKFKDVLKSEEDVF